MDQSEESTVSTMESERVRAEAAGGEESEERNSDAVDPGSGDAEAGDSETVDESVSDAGDSEVVDESVDEAGESEAVGDSVDEAGDQETVDPESELEKARTEAAENYDRYLRTAADLENFRKRTLKMRSETREETVRDLLLQVAPLLDNMRRALSQETEDAAAVKQGVELIVNQFQGILKGYGLEEIEARGEPFDPNLHEAMMEVPNSEHPPGTVLKEMEKGYTLRDKVVLPARVVVSKAGEAQPQDGESEVERDG